jgi:hypothetical protein
VGALSQLWGMERAEGERWWKICHGEYLGLNSRLDFGNRGHEILRMRSTGSEVEGSDGAPEQTVLLDPYSRATKIPKAQEEVGAMGPGMMHIVKSRGISSTMKQPRTWYELI